MQQLRLGQRRYPDRLSHVPLLQVGLDSAGEGVENTFHLGPHFVVSHNLQNSVQRGEEMPGEGRLQTMKESELAQNSMTVEIGPGLEREDPTIDYDFDRFIHHWWNPKERSNRLAQIIACGYKPFIVIIRHVFLGVFEAPPVKGAAPLAAFRQSGVSA